MVDIPLLDFNQSGSQTPGNALLDMANQAADFYCELYKNDPLGVTGGLIRTPVGNAVNALNSSICTPRGKVPNPPTQQFGGGQCPKLYNVDVRYRVRATLAETFTTLFNVRGAIQGTYIRNFGTSPGTKQFGVRGTLVDGSPQFVPVFSVNPSVEPGGYIFIEGITAQDGTDNCGNPAPTYPPVVAPNNNYTENRDIDFGGGLILNVPLTFIPVKIDANVQIKPEIVIDVGGIQVKFDAGGVTFDFGINGDIPVIFPLPDTDPRPNPPTPIPPSGGGGGGGDCPDVNLKPVLDKFPPIEELLKDIKECACPEDKVPVQTYYAPRNSNFFSLPEDPTTIFLNVTFKGQEVRGEFGGGGAPNVEYVGWYAFGFPGGVGDRKPISYMANGYEVPATATGFCYTLKYNSLAEVTVFHLVPPPEP